MQIAFGILKQKVNSFSVLNVIKFTVFHIKNVKQTKIRECFFFVIVVCDFTFTKNWFLNKHQKQKWRMNEQTIRNLSISTTVQDTIASWFFDARGKGKKNERRVAMKRDTHI